MTQTPTATLSLCLLACGLALLPSAIQTFLLFDMQQLQSGNAVGLVTGHWIHADREHLIWNVSALAILGALVEVHSRRLLIIGLMAGTVAVNLLLLSPFTDINQYCGLSGILNTLMGLVLFVLWLRTHSRIVIGVGILCLLKIVVEVVWAKSLFTSTSWPPFALAHFAGLAAAPLALWLDAKRTRWPERFNVMSALPTQKAITGVAKVELIIDKEK